MPKITIEELYNQFNHKTRLIINDISGLIFEQYPNIKEKITYQKLTYTDTEKGKIIEIKPTHNQIQIKFLKQKHTLTYQTSEEINLNEIKKYLKPKLI